jgi:NADP-dependent 3-hydroxy acid dehydrogenase YdfG
LVLVGRRAEPLEAAAGKIRGTGQHVATVAIDVADKAAPERIVEAARAWPAASMHWSTMLMVD